MSRIVSSLPGRIRIRDKGLRDPARQTQLSRELANITAITQWQANPRTGSVVVSFDPGDTPMAELEAKLDAAVDNVLGDALTPPLLTKKRINRYNKIAMLGSLAASLALTTVRRKRWRHWHAATGYLFVANLGVHLYLYRKSLFR
ncbi:HMA2 domain-containing protein [Methylomonas sp. CM2]|uniref:HMA2 domain-containing protein n=1 Tax=Methylomonas sp. CM2 TaxID=3417647 RepID=UPI003CE78C2E